MRNKTMINRKGIAPIVSLAITISLIIAAMAIVGPMILDAIRGPMLSPAVSCNDMRTFQPVRMTDLCYTSESEVKIKIERTFDDIEIPSLTFSYDSAAGIRTWECSPACGNCEVLSPGETKFYYLTIGESVANAGVTLTAGECAVEHKEITKPCA